MALKAQQYQIVKAKDTKALLTSLLIIPELRVLVLTKRHVGSGNEIGAGWIFQFPTSCAWARTRTAKRVTTKRARIRWASVNLKKSKKFQSFLPSQPEYQERLSGKGGGGGADPACLLVSCKRLQTFECKRVTRRGDSTRDKKQPGVV